MGLAFESRQTCQIPLEFARQDFDGYFPPQLCISCTVDFAHTARAQWSQDFVCAQPKSWEPISVADPFSVADQWASQIGIGSVKQGFHFAPQFRFLRAGGCKKIVRPLSGVPEPGAA